MSFLASLRHRLRVLLRPGAYQRELEEETRFHLAQEASRQGAARPGLSAEAARLEARRRYGNVTGIDEARRQMAGLGMFEMVRQDVRFALRSFLGTPGFTAVAVLTLAIGIGGTTAIFSAVNALLLRPLPFRDPERLMMVSMTTPAEPDRPASDNMVWSYPKFTVFRDAQTAFQDLAVTTDFQVTLTGGGEAERVNIEYVGGRYLPTLGVQPALGRNFLPEEDRNPGGPKVVLLSDALWQRRYNADPRVLGQILDVGGEPFTIVGVLPPGFKGISGRSDIMVPVLSGSAEDINQAWSHSYYVVARLKPGVSPAQATAEARLLGTRVDAAYPHPEVKDRHWGATAKPLDSKRVDPVIRRSLLVLLGAVGLVLLIACANVANLFLVRASGRRREIAVRLAVGAGRGRLVRQLLTESVLISVVGGAASLVLAWGGVRVLATINPASALRTQRLEGLGVVNFSTIHLDPTAFGFAAAITLLTGLIFGLIPALSSTRPALTAELKEGSAAAPSHRLLRGFNSRSVLAAVEIALALVLLAGSGLMLRSLDHLLRVDPGFNPDRVLTLRLNSPPTFARDSLPGFYDRMLERLAAIPGVTGATLADCPPLSGGCSGTVIAFRDRPPAQPGTEPSIGVYWVTPQWTATLGVPLLRGRMFTAADRAGAPKVVVVNDAAAKAFWPGQDPIGKPVSVGQGGFWNDTARVVGVVGNVRFGTVDTDPVPDAFLSYYQSPRGRMMVFLRTAGDPLGVAGPARRIIRDLAPDIPVYDIRTLESRTGDSMSYARFSTLLLVLFAGVALALATLGTYGVVSFAVAQRTREFGIRIALGATRGSVTRLVVGQGIGIALAGGTVGLLAAFGATRVLRSLLFNVAPSDPLTFAGIAALLVLAVAAASWLPARRATGIQPTEALRDG
jgi:putative ABC transport system permease protein